MAAQTETAKYRKLDTPGIGGGEVWVPINDPLATPTETAEPTTTAEDVGAAMLRHILSTYGRRPTHDEFDQIYWAWNEKVEAIFDAE